MKPIIAFFIFTILLACRSTPDKVEESTNSDSLMLDSAELAYNSDSTEVDSVEPELLTHKGHKEDDEYPWYDTNLGGQWVKKSVIDSLLSIFDNDTTRSLLEYVETINQCESQLISIYFEGCKKDNIFYVKNLGCYDKYISYSDFGIDEKDTFELVDVYSGKKYLIESPRYSVLFINGEEYVDNFYMSDITELLEGGYVIYDHDDSMIDTVNYNNDRFYNSDTLVYMRLWDVIHFGSHPGERPMLKHSDFVSIEFYTGDSTEAEVPGGTETVPETFRVRFDLKRCDEGFELHNGYDEMGEKYLNKGLVYKFDLIGNINLDSY